VYQRLVVGVNASSENRATDDRREQPPHGYRAAMS
jgi:hypothetical protein